MEEEKKVLFSVKTEDKCIWLIDHRSKPSKKIHMTKGQALTIGKIVADMGFCADDGKAQNWPIYK